MKAKTLLYKLDSNDRTRIWWIEQEHNKYRTHSGLLDGGIVISEWTYAQKKKIGRSNETAAIEQATAEVAAKYKKKMEQGAYVDDLKKLHDYSYFHPMLAATYKGWKDTWTDVRCQPKLDGMRCLATKDGLWTRKGKRIVSVPHIWEVVKPFFTHYPKLVLDGELYNHDLRDDFNTIMSLCRKTVLGNVDLEKTKIIQYHLYDVYGPVPFCERWEYLLELLADYPLDYIRLVPTFEVHGREDLNELHNDCLIMGFEGSIIRLSPKASSYTQNSRSPNLLKRKEWITAEFEIVRIEEGVGNLSGMAGSVICKIGDKEFGTGITGGRRVNRYIWSIKDELIEKEATVKYFALTPDGLPRFAQCIETFVRGRND